MQKSGKEGGSGMVKHRAVKGKRTKGEGTVRHCQRCGGKKQGARFQRGRDLQDKKVNKGGGQKKHDKN